MAFIENNLSKAVKEWRDKGLAMVGDKAEQNVSGKVLQIRSGDLLKDVQEHQQAESPNSFSIGTSLIYGKAWEQGFRRKAYTVRPRRAKALKIPVGGIGAEEFIFRLRAEIPAGNFAPKPFLEPAIQDSRKDLVSLLGKAISTAKLFTPKTIEVKLGARG